MPPRLLYPQRKRVEMLVALFAGGFGIYLLAILGVSGAPLAWAGLDREGSAVFALVAALAAILHGVGVWINGRWRWSPAFRLCGMATHAGLSGWLAWKGQGMSAGYPYTWFALLLVYGCVSAWIDMRRAGTGWKPI